MSKKKRQKRQGKRRDQRTGISITPEAISMWITRQYPPEVPEDAIKTLDGLVELWLDGLAKQEPAMAKGIKELKEWRQYNSASPEEAAELLHEGALREATRRGLRIVA